MAENPDIGMFDLADIAGNSPDTIYEKYKKSALGHMKDVVLGHPAFKGDKSPELVSEQLIKAVLRIVDRVRYPLHLTEENGELVIRVKNLMVDPSLLNEIQAGGGVM